MKDTWFRWLFLCFLATLPYNLYGFIFIYFSSPLEKIGFFIGSVLVFSLFITVFYGLDNCLTRHGYTKFNEYFLAVVGWKIIGLIVSGILLFFTHSEMVFYAIFADIAMTMGVYEFLQSNVRETAQTVITNPEWYSLLKDLIVVPIFLIVEGVFLLIGTIIAGTLEHLLKNKKH